MSDAAEGKPMSTVSVKHKLLAVIVSHYAVHRYTDAARAEVLQALTELSAQELSMVRNDIDRIRAVEEHAVEVARQVMRQRMLRRGRRET